jgi:hypothetical protein
MKGDKRSDSMIERDIHRISVQLYLPELLEQLNGSEETICDCVTLALKPPVFFAKLYVSLIGAAPSEAVSWQRLELACWLFDYIRDLWLAVNAATATGSD